MAMERDLQFLLFLLKAPIYQKQSPNLYERLREYTIQAIEFSEALQQLNWEQAGPLEGFEERLVKWKRELYEFLESKL